MKLTLKTQFLPTPEQAQALEATMRAFDAAADWLAGEAFARKTANKFLPNGTRVSDRIFVSSHPSHTTPA